MKVLDTALTLAAIALFFIACAVIGPAIETRYFPVYTKFKISYIETTPDGGSIVTFSFTKLRECAPAGVNWFIGEPGGAYRQIELISNRPPDAPPINRSLGFHVSVPYKVDVAPAVLRDQGFASVYSNCHPLWVTRSVIYP